MARALVRIVVIFVAVYLLTAHIVAQYGYDILYGNHVVLFEFLTLAYTFSEGKYHCRYLRFTMLGIVIAEVISRSDNMFDYLSVPAHNIIIANILAISILIPLCKSINHFYKVRKHGIQRTIPRKEDGFKPIG